MGSCFFFIPFRIEAEKAGDPVVMGHSLAATIPKISSQHPALDEHQPDCLLLE